MTLNLLMSFACTWKRETSAETDVSKRPSTSLKYDYTLELTEYKEERIKYLIDYGIIRDSGNFLWKWRMYILNSSRRFYKSMRT